MIVHGDGLINKVINNLPVELHIPGYNYCGPGTKLRKRIARGDKGINSLDEACKDHDIAYSQSNNLIERHKADQILQEKAWQRVKSKDAPFGEKVSAWTVTNLMKAKRKFGMGHNTKKQKKRRVIKTPKKKIGGILPALIPFLP